MSEVTIRNDNHPAIRAYEKAGFSKYLITMRKQITPP